jgi:hypothetical protein
MLEPWIIEQIRRREEEERRKHERPQLELPVSDEPWPPHDSDRSRPERPGRRERQQDDESEPQRGVVIIGL